MVMSVKVNVHQAKTYLSRLLDQALAGAEVIIMRSGRPLARLIPIKPPRTLRTLGSAKGEFVVPDDFDAPLPEDVLAAFER